MFITLQKLGQIQIFILFPDGFLWMAVSLADDNRMLLKNLRY